MCNCVLDQHCCVCDAAASAVYDDYTADLFGDDEDETVLVCPACRQPGATEAPSAAYDERDTLQFNRTGEILFRCPVCEYTDWEAEFVEMFPEEVEYREKRRKEKRDAIVNDWAQNRARKMAEWEEYLDAHNRNVEATAR